MNDVTKRFFETIEALGETPYRISKNVPVASSAKLSNAKNGLNEIGLDVVSGVCEYYRNINGNYILTGRGLQYLYDNEIISVMYEGSVDLGLKTESAIKSNLFDAEIIRLKDTRVDLIKRLSISVLLMIFGGIIDRLLSHIHIL